MQTLLKSTGALMSLFLLSTGCSSSDAPPVASSASDVAPKASQVSQADRESLPQNIADAVNAEKPGSTITAAYKEQEKGKTVYEVMVEMPDGTGYEIEVGAQGKILEVEKSNSTPLAVPEGLPQLIIDAVNAEKPGAAVIAAFEEREKGKTIFEVMVEMPDGKGYEIEVGAKGKVLEVERADFTPLALP